MAREGGGWLTLGQVTDIGRLLVNIFVPIGPLAIPLNALLILIAVCLALWITARDARRSGIKTEAQTWLVLAVGLVAARLGFVFSYAAAYLAEPMSLLDIRDGGWNPWWGLAGIWAATLLLAYRRPAHARPVIKGMSTLSLGVLLVVTLAALPTDANRPLPALPVTALDGQAVSLPGFAGKPTVINLWASWCGPCRREMPMLQQAQERHPEVNFVFLNQGEDAVTVERFLQGDRLALDNVLLDRGTEMGHMLGQRGLPVTLFYNAEGFMEDIRLGELSRGSLAQRLEALGGTDQPVP